MSDDEIDCHPAFFYEYHDAIFIDERIRHDW